MIVNHHLFFADLTIKQQSEYAPDAGVLPEAGAVIFDEAHELEDVASSYFGVSVSNARIDELARDVEQCANTQSHLFGGTLRSDGQLARPCRAVLFAACRRGRDGLPLRTGAIFWKKTAKNTSALRNSLQRLDSELQQMPEKPEEVFAFSRRAGETAVSTALPDGRGESEYGLLD